MVTIPKQLNKQYFKNKRQINHECTKTIDFPPQCLDNKCVNGAQKVKNETNQKDGSIKISYNIGSVGNVSQFNDNTAGYLIWVIENEIWMRVCKIVAVMDDIHENDDENMKYDENNA